ncbi:BZIP transcription factor [Penicillium taxi]|uniref:BZIP transcription factor n=1 Tax=Penicillium taxi TaxID=168475 RepID=UPI0025450659|nr:BZIP transcription factor [Penicillium taxi]KAJ5895493.1 BZIP transcription factor [Penicillium taxi]
MKDHEGTSWDRRRRVRSVHTLTEEQIRQKRETDRRAQRAQRQRSKDSISTLEQQLAQLQQRHYETNQELSLLREQNINLQCLAQSRATEESSPFSTGSTCQPITYPVIGARDTLGSPCTDPAAVHLILPPHVPPTCPLDKLLLDLIGSHRDMIARNIPPDIVLGFRQPCVKALIAPEQYKHAHVGVVISDILTRFPGFGQFERMAFFYIMNLTIKWQTLASKEHYLAMPRWLRPTLTQTQIPHPMWIDNIPWPEMRDVLIENMEDHTHPEFSPYFSSEVCINWPSDIDEATSSQGDMLIMSPTFERHIRDLNNWSMSTRFKSRFSIIYE